MQQSFTSSLILVSVATGIAFTAFIGDVTKSVEVMNILFICFAGAIIAVQLIPSYLLFKRILGKMLFPHGVTLKKGQTLPIKENRNLSITLNGTEVP
jgi:hypothetical protein